MVTPETKPMVTPVEAVKQGFRKYVDFGGRATRAEYWWWVLFTILAGIVLSIIDSIIGFSDPWDYGPLYTLFVLATLLPSLAVAARRLHDIGKTGWWQLAWYAIPAIAWLATGIMFLVTLVPFPLEYALYRIFVSPVSHSRASRNPELEAAFQYQHI